MLDQAETSDLPVEPRKDRRGGRRPGAGRPPKRPADPSPIDFDGGTSKPLPVVDPPVVIGPKPSEPPPALPDPVVEEADRPDVVGGDVLDPPARPDIMKPVGTAFARAIRLGIG